MVVEGKPSERSDSDCVEISSLSDIMILKTDYEKEAKLIGIVREKKRFEEKQKGDSGSRTDYEQLFWVLFLLGEVLLNKEGRRQSFPLAKEKKLLDGDCLLRRRGRKREVLDARTCSHCCSRLCSVISLLLRHKFGLWVSAVGLLCLWSKRDPL